MATTKAPPASTKSISTLFIFLSLHCGLKVGIVEMMYMPVRKKKNARKKNSNITKHHGNAYQVIFSFCCGLRIGTVKVKKKKRLPIYR